jgi:hypothetical protein
MGNGGLLLLEARCRKVKTSKYPPWSGQPPTTQTYTIETEITIFEEPLISSCLATGRVVAVPDSVCPILPVSAQS